MGHHVSRRQRRKIKTAAMWVLSVIGGIGLIYALTPLPPRPTATAPPAAGAAPATSNAASPDGGAQASDASKEVWHCKKCGRDWPAFRLCCWEPTEQVR